MKILHEKRARPISQCRITSDDRSRASWPFRKRPRSRGFGGGFCTALMIQTRLRWAAKQAAGLTTRTVMISSQSDGASFIGGRGDVGPAYCSRCRRKPTLTAPKRMVKPRARRRRIRKQNAAIMFGSRNTTGAIRIPAMETIAAAMPPAQRDHQAVLMPTSRADSAPMVGGRGASPTHEGELNEEIEQDQEPTVTPIMPADGWR